MRKRVVVGAGKPKKLGVMKLSEQAEKAAAGPCFFFFFFDAGRIRKVFDERRADDTTSASPAMRF